MQTYDCRWQQLNSGISTSDMENSQSVVICFMFLHLIGIICVALNAYYLKRTRGYDSARIQLNAPNSEKKRLFKIRNSIACNILIVYHITLTALELGMAIIYQIPQMYNESYTSAYFLLVGINYGILVLLCLPWAFLSGTFKSHAHLGHVHACNAFEFFNLVIHWARYCWLWSVLKRTAVIFLHIWDY